jgi:hypothetical protein
MAQIFHPSMKVISRASIILVVIVIGVVSWVAAEIFQAGYTTDVELPREQPVPFSHEHHVNGLGIQCAYCHTSAERSSFAGIPPTHTCMTCHSQIWITSPMLKPVRESYRTQRPLQWLRVHDLPDFVYFNHSIHLNKGIGCETCHGRVDLMPLVWKVHTLYMGWCLDCHRAPEKYIRPKAEIFTMGWTPTSSQGDLGTNLVRQYNVHVSQLSDCSICHR